MFWQLLFWILMALWLIGALINWPTTGTPAGFRPLANNLMLWVLLFILGVFAIKFPALP